MTGRLCADPELRKTPSDVSVCSFRIANDRDYSKNGEKETDFFDVVAWRVVADFICKYFTKGRLITLDGRLQTRARTDRDGNKRIVCEIVVDNAYFGDSKRNDSGQAAEDDPGQYTGSYGSFSNNVPGAVSGGYAPDFD
jgi:single-strand DNA-binding protein